MSGAYTNHETILQGIREALEEADRKAREDEVELFRGRSDGSEANIETIERKTGVMYPWLVVTLTDSTAFKIMIERTK